VGLLDQLQALTLHGLNGRCVLEADIPTGLLNSHSQPKGGKFTNACEILK